MQMWSKEWRWQQNAVSSSVEREKISNSVEYKLDDISNKDAMMFW